MPCHYANEAPEMRAHFCQIIILQRIYSAGSLCESLSLPDASCVDKSFVHSNQVLQLWWWKVSHLYKYMAFKSVLILMFSLVFCISASIIMNSLIFLLCPADVSSLTDNKPGSVSWRQVITTNTYELIRPLLSWQLSKSAKVICLFLF